MHLVRTGLDLLAAEDFQTFRGQRIGLVAHPASVDSRFRHAADLLQAAPGVKLEIVFGPEHGWFGDAQDLEAVADAGTTPQRGPRIVSLYGETAASLRPKPEYLSGLDALVIDLQDVGSRYYTFQATMLYCLEAAHELGLRIVVLDRPNPIGGEIEGPALLGGFESFIGAHNVPVRHGLTVGELAKLYQTEKKLENASLEVVRCEGWSRTLYFDNTSLPWVLPSPNMPTIETALVYPGQCLLEGTNLSEGRGTTKPFELCGAPWLDAASLTSRIRSEELPGIAFRPAWFEPTFQKHGGKLCAGVQFHITNRQHFKPVRAGLALLSALRECSGGEFKWRTETYEFVSDPVAIDLLFGSARERTALDSDVPWRDIAALWCAEEEEFAERRRPYLLYPE